MIVATCPSCGAQTFKIPNEADLDSIEDCRDPNTSRAHLHEGNDKVHGGIGIKAEIESLVLNFDNDRIIYEWQKLAGRHDEKTVDRHLAAIRYCERTTKGKAFDRFTAEDACRVRDDLKRRAKPDAPDHLSSSSIRHIVSHLRAFFEWLFKQDGFKRLPRDLPDYFQLPKAILAAAVRTKVKEYPTLAEAEDMLRQMPSKSLRDHRARSIFAIAFLGGQRADTIVSLKFEHVDIANGRICQDASALRAKNGKSLNVVWFPIPVLFAEVITAWKELLAARGFRDGDALFPDLKWLERDARASSGDRQPIAVMSTKHAVTDAFVTASRGREMHYTPHSAKHTLAAERDTRQLTRVERKAWSENLGHENEQITETRYGKLTEEQRINALENIGQKGSGEALGLTKEERMKVLSEMTKLLGL